MDGEKKIFITISHLSMEFVDLEDGAKNITAR